MKKYAFAALAAALFTATAAQASGSTYAIDPTHTFVSFEIGHFGTSTNRGRWDKKEGSVQFDRAGKSGKVEITLDMNSINTGVVPFDGHLKSADFFNVAQHPTGKFVSERFVFNGDKLAEVRGTLTLLGKSNPVSLKAINFNCYDSPMLKREVCGGDFEGTIQRSQFGLGAYAAVAPDAVRLLVQIEAVKQ
jgi:polyisoprenoid-binding protein YceI